MTPFSLVSCIILSAGDSGRMGMHKAMLPFGNQKLTFLEKIIKSYRHAGINQIVVVVNSGLLRQIIDMKLKLPAGIQIVENLHPEKGRFYSLQTGLKYVKTGSHVFIQNIDNPFIDQKVLNLMLEYINGALIAHPVFSGKTGHPVLIHPDVCESIISSECLDARIDCFLKDYPSLKIEVNDPGIFANINTPEDYMEAFGIVNNG
jgi:molybdenum cofactor cytidylyltransferase/nicotine blue oxidoreductase